MQLAFCIYKYFPFGGLQRDFLQVANVCQSRGHKIRIYVMSWQGVQPTNFEIIFVPTKGVANHSRNQFYVNWVKTHLQMNPVDSVIGFNKMPGLDTYFAGDTCFAEKVSHKGFFYKLSNRCKHYLAFENAVFSRQSKTKLMVLTKQQIHDFEKYYHTQPERFYLLPPGIAIDRKYQENSIIQRQKFRHANQIKDDNFVIVQVGSDFKRKGVDRSLQAIASLPSELKQKIIYFVIGQDNPEAYQKIAKQKAISHQVKFYAGRNDIPNFLFAADLLLHPARQEAAGMVLIEALAAGLPVIVSGVSGYAYHITDADAGIVLSEPYLQSDLNQILQSVMTNKVQLNKWHNNAIKYGHTFDLYNLADCAADIILDGNNHE